MEHSADEVMRLVQENGIEFIRLVFCDIFGVQKNISVLPAGLESAFKSGLPLDAAAVGGFAFSDASGLLLAPEPETFDIMPQNGTARLYCNIKNSDGTAFEGDGRRILKNAVEYASGAGYECRIGMECGFYLFETDEKGNKTEKPNDHAGLCDTAPADKGEKVRRGVCLALDAMHIFSENAYHGRGPGQNAIRLGCDCALSAADNLITLKSQVKYAAECSGLYASFMPKPFAKESGSGLSVRLALFKKGNTDGEDASEAESFAAGIMSRASELTAILNPTTNSYARLESYSAPKHINCSRKNGSSIVKAPEKRGGQAEMELLSPDPTCNPYWALALLIYAGMDGIKNGMKLSSWEDKDIFTYGENEPEMLPESLDEAVGLAEKSDFIRRVIPEKALEAFFEAKKMEYGRYVKALDKKAFESEEYYTIT